MNHIDKATQRAQEVSALRRSVIFHSSELKRIDRELFAKSGWLRAIVKGWYVLVHPCFLSDDSSWWYAYFWDFFKSYLSRRFGDAYCLYAEHSLELHVESPIVPRVVRAIVPTGEEKSIDLLIEYLQKLKNGAVYKRLGFLTEKYFPEENRLIDECQARLTAGNAKLDFSLNCNKLVTKWKLFVPENWK